MKSAGVYWKFVFNVLEADFEILLVNVCHVKNVSGHKTDKKDRALKRKYESLVGRRGKKKAFVAVEYKNIVTVYHMMNNKEAYKEPQLHDSPKKQNEKIHNYLNRLKDLGVEVEYWGDKIQQGWFFYWA